MDTYQSIYANWHLLDLLLLNFHFTQQKRFPTWLFIVPSSQLTSFLLLTHYILIFYFKKKSIKVLLNASIGLQPNIALTLHLEWRFLPHTQMLHILNIIRPQFMLSNISQVRINTAYPSTQSLLQQYKHSTISHTVAIKRHTQKLRSLPCHNSTKK